MARLAPGLLAAVFLAALPRFAPAEFPDGKAAWEEWRSGLDSYARDPKTSYLAVADAVYLEKGQTAFLLEDDPRRWVRKMPAKGELLHVFYDGSRALLSPAEGETFDLLKRGEFPLSGGLVVMANELRDGSLRLFIRDPAHELLRGFTGLRFFPYDPAAAVVATLEPRAKPVEHVFATTAGRSSKAWDVGRLRFRYAGEELSLTAYTFDPPASARDLFVPLLDQSARDETYAGGRYLDLEIPAGVSETQVVLDLNYAYNPYCARSKFYNCVRVPGRPLKVRVRAGEKRPEKGDH